MVGSVAACSLTTSLAGLSGTDAADGGSGGSGDAGGDASGDAPDASLDAVAIDSPSGLRVTRLRLINNDTGAPLAGYDPLAADVTIAKSALAKATLEAFAEGSPPLESIGFDIDSVAVSTENRTPFVLSGDRDGGGYYAWDPPVGSFVLTVIPYTKADRGGMTGTARTVRFSVLP